MRVGVIGPLHVEVAGTPVTVASRLEVRMHLALWRGDLETCLDVATHASMVTDDPYEQVPD
jgi:hypothetical protein